MLHSVFCVHIAQSSPRRASEVDCGLSSSVAQVEAPLSAAKVAQVNTDTVPHNPHWYLNESACHVRDRKWHFSVR